MKRASLRSVVIALAVLGSFVPVLSNGFVSWDDSEALVANDALRAPGLLSWAFTTSHMSHFQPLSWLGWAWAGRLLGASPEVFHTLSLLFHSANAVLLFFLLSRLCSGELAPFAASLLYALHPLRVEPVAWASAFPYLLATSFLLVAALLYLRRSLAGSAAAYALSVLARPLAPGFPFVLLALDVFPAKRERTWRLVTEKIPFFGVAILGLFLEARSRRFLDFATYGLGARLTLVGDSLLAHFGRLLWPVGLTPLDPLPLEPSFDGRAVALGVLLLVGTAALAFFLRSHFPAAPILWFCWLVLLAPSLGLTPSGLQATADRYSYLPGIVLAIAVGALLARWPEGASVASVVLAALLGGVSFHQCGLWKDSVTLWGRAVELDPRNDLALYFYASALAQAGRLDEARRDYERLLEMIPDHGPARKDLARLDSREADALASKSELALAVELYSRALALDPEIPDVREHRAMALFQQGRFGEALPELEAVSATGAADPEVSGAYAMLLLQNGRVSDAVRVLDQAVRQFPEDLGLLHNLARVLSTHPVTGRKEEAVALAQRVVDRTDGRDPRALDTLGFALASRGSREESLRAFERAMSLARSRGDEELAREVQAHAQAVAR